MTRRTARRVSNILCQAKTLRKPCTFKNYEHFKLALTRCNLNSTEYARAIRALCDVLEL